MHGRLAKRVLRRAFAVRIRALQHRGKRRGCLHRGRPGRVLLPGGGLRVGGLHERALRVAVGARVHCHRGEELTGKPDNERTAP